MNFTEKQKEEFEEAARPLIKFLNENSNPHAVVVVNTTNAILFTGEMNFRTEEYLVDREETKPSSYTEAR